MLDAVDAAALKFTENVMERCATPMLQRKFVALGGLDMLINFIRTSVNDEVVSRAATVLHMLVVTSKGECLSSHGGAVSCDTNGISKMDSLASEMCVVTSLLVQLRRTRNKRAMLAVTCVLNDVLASYLSVRGPDATAAPLFPYPDETATLVVGLLERKTGQEEWNSAVSSSNLSLAPQPKTKAKDLWVGKAGSGIMGSCPTSGKDRRKNFRVAEGCAHLTADSRKGICEQRMAGDNKHQQIHYSPQNAALKQEREKLDAECAALIYHMCVDCGGLSAVGHETASMAAKLGKAGGVEALLALCEECVDENRLDGSCIESPVLRWAVNALCALLMSDKNHEAFAAAKGPQLFIHILNSSLMNGPLLELPKDSVTNSTRALVHQGTHHLGSSSKGLVMMPELFGDYWLDLNLHDGLALRKATADAVDVSLQRRDCSAQVLEQLARSLSNFMASHSSQTIVASVGGTEVLIKVIQEHVNLVNKANRDDGSDNLVVGFVKPNDAASHFAEDDARLTSVADVAVIQQVCAALCNLTFENDSNRIRVGQADGCEALVELCKAYIMRSPRRSGRCQAVIEQCCAAIGNICKKNRTNRATVGKVGGCEVLVQVVVDAPSESCLIQAVRAIGNVATRCSENQLKFAAADCIRLIVRLIQTFSLRVGADLGAIRMLGSWSEAGQPVCGIGHSVPYCTVDVDANDRLQRALTCLTAISNQSPSNSQSCSNLTSAASTPRGARCNTGHSNSEHRETLLHLSLSALIILIEHDCCRSQLTNNSSLPSLLNRIVQMATLCETQLTARRLLVVLGYQEAADKNKASTSTVEGERRRDTEVAHGPVIVNSCDLQAEERCNEQSMAPKEQTQLSYRPEDTATLFSDKEEAEAGKDYEFPVEGIQCNQDQVESEQTVHPPAIIIDFGEDWDSDDYGDNQDSRSVHEVSQGAHAFCEGRTDDKNLESNPVEEGMDNLDLANAIHNDEVVDEGDIMDELIDAFSDSRSVASCRPSSRASSRSGRDVFNTEDRDECYENDNEDQYDCDMYGSCGSLKSEDWKVCDGSNECESWSYGRSGDMVDITDDPTTVAFQHANDQYQCRENCHQSRLTHDDASCAEAFESSVFSEPYLSRQAYSRSVSKLAHDCYTTNQAALALFSDESSSESGGHLAEVNRASGFSTEEDERGRDVHVEQDEAIPRQMNETQNRPVVCEYRVGEEGRRFGFLGDDPGSHIGSGHSEYPSVSVSLACQGVAPDVDAVEWSSGDERGASELLAEQAWMDKIGGDAYVGGDAGLKRMLLQEDSTVSTQPSGEISREVVCDGQGVTSVWSEESISMDTMAVPSASRRSPTLGSHPSRYSPALCGLHLGETPVDLKGEEGDDEFSPVQGQQDPWPCTPPCH